MPFLPLSLLNGNAEKTALWHITEDEHFFLHALAEAGYYPDEQDLPRHPKRRLERLAGRFLLKQLAPDFPLHLIRKDEHDKPRIPGNQYFFSITHSFPYAAVTLSDRHEVGIDIQCWHPRMERLADKFLSSGEQDLLRYSVELFTLAWCMKEAAYKWHGRRGIDFINDLPLLRFGVHRRKDSEPFSYSGSMFFRNEKHLTLQGTIHNEFAIAKINSCL